MKQTCGSQPGLRPPGRGGGVEPLGRRGGGGPEVAVPAAKACRDSRGWTLQNTDGLLARPSLADKEVRQESGHPTPNGCRESRWRIGRTESCPGRAKGRHLADRELLFGDEKEDSRRQLLAQGAVPASGRLSLSGRNVTLPGTEPEYRLDGGKPGRIEVTFRADGPTKAFTVQTVLPGRSGASSGLGGTRLPASATACLPPASCGLTARRHSRL